MKKGMIVTGAVMLLALGIGFTGTSVCRADTFFDFQYLMSENNMKGIQDLLDKGTNVNTKNDQGMTILMAAALKSNTPVVELFLNKGADVNAKTDDGMTALMVAASVGNPAIVKLLVDKGADVSAKDKAGKTAVDYAKEKGFNEIVSLLQK